MLSREELFNLYVIKGLSDREIAEIYGYDRTSILCARKKYGIPTRQNTGIIGELIAENTLRQLGFPVLNMNNLDKLHSYDLQVGQIRIEVKSSGCIHKGEMRFQLSTKATSGISTKNKHYTILPNGRFRKDFRKTCDIVMLVGIKPRALYIIPSEVIPVTQQTIGIGVNSKWEVWRNRFDILQDLLNNQRKGVRNTWAKQPESSEKGRRVEISGTR